MKIKHFFLHLDKSNDRKLLQFGAILIFTRYCVYLIFMSLVQDMEGLCWVLTLRPVDI
jgi:hypothetical protein